MAADKTRRTGTPLQDLLRGARRPPEPDATESERPDVAAVPAPVDVPGQDLPQSVPDLAVSEASCDVTSSLAPAAPPPAYEVPVAGRPSRLPTTPIARDSFEDTTPLRPMEARPATPERSRPERAGDPGSLARRGQKARPTILIEPADHQTLRDWQAEAAEEWQSRVLDDSKIVRALIQAAREAAVPIGTAGGEAHLRRLLVGVMRRGMAAGPG